MKVTNIIKPHIPTTKLQQVFASSIVFNNTIYFIYFVQYLFQHNAQYFIDALNPTYSSCTRHILGTMQYILLAPQHYAQNQTLSFLPLILSWEDFKVTTQRKLVSSHLRKSLIK